MIPSQALLELGPDFYDVVEPARFPEKIPRFLNKNTAQNVGIHLSSDNEWIRRFAEFQPWPGSLPNPLALRYHGHQFRQYNPELGDGRGFVYAQVEAGGRLLDFGTKGSGQTPYSRRGDGRLTLKGAVREALATEMLESLGVNTSKTFCFFETGESLHRSDEPSPTRAAVLTRLSHSHIRFGTFQRLAYLEQPENIRTLLHYCGRHYFPNLSNLDGVSLFEKFLQTVSDKSAELLAQWMVAGFVHGVLNSDNMNITGESFDYGPYRFLPVYDPGFTAAYFDHSGLYCFGRQPAAVFWNLQQLGATLQFAEPALDPSRVYQSFEVQWESALRKNFLRRLNLADREETPELLAHFFQALGKTQMSFETGFFKFFGGLENPNLDTSSLPSEFHGFVELLKLFRPQNENSLTDPFFEMDQPCTLLIDEIEKIWSAIDTNDDWEPFHKKIQAIRQFRSVYLPSN